MYFYVFICIYILQSPSQVDRDAVSTASEIKASAVEEVLSDLLIYISVCIHTYTKTYTYTSACVHTPLLYTG